MTKEELQELLKEIDEAAERMCKTVKESKPAVNKPIKKEGKNDSKRKA